MKKPLRHVEKDGIIKTIAICQNCGHEWTVRGDNKPRLCPNRNCHSSRWDRVKDADI